MHSVQSSACLVHSEINMTIPGVLYSHVLTIYSEDHLRSFWYKMTAIVRSIRCGTEATSR